ncbi:Uncharacterised protein [Mycobacteroides abscessus subsp. abscessus]|nr:Uncharacterised protein [Mycobacteroides abscessus subsp. abscessus]
MPMTDQQLVVLLGVIAAHDGRMLDEATEALWRRAAHRYGWEFDECVEAVDAYFAEPLEMGARRPWFDPGQMRRMLRALRPGGTGPAPVGEVLGGPRLALTRGGRASAEKRAQVMAALRELLPAGRVTPRRPLWDPANVRGEADTGEVVEVERARDRFRALTARPSGQEPATAFGGRPGGR